MFNLYTKKAFTGKNLEKLQATKLTGGFCTFRQAKLLGGKIIKGSKAVARLSRITAENGKDSEFRSYCVFHQSQIKFRKED